MLDLGRYVLYDQIASGGMAAVHLGVVKGDGGFRRTVAIKRLHPHVAASPGALEMFIDEARLSARVTHRNIVNTLDVVHSGNELFLVMEYVHGVPLATLDRRERIPLPIVSAIMLDVLAGLSAIHGARDESTRPLSIVHRDISPQNILVSADGTARVLDFGIAKAAVRLHTTKDDRVKGKLHYMAPEQFLDEEVDARTDQFAAGVVLWGLLTGRRLFEATNEAAIVARVLEGVIQPPSQVQGALEGAKLFDDLVMRALERSKDKRFTTCEELATALRLAQPPATPDEVKSWVENSSAEILASRSTLLARIEAGEPTTSSSVAHEPFVATETLTDVDPPKKRTAAHRRSLLFAVAAVIATIAVAIAAVILIRPRAPATETATPPPSAAAPTPVVVAPTPQPSASGIITITTASASTKTLRHAPTPSKKAACAQMTKPDENGIQRVKPECL